MIKFMLAARRKPQDTQEKYFYEWGIIHVALMLGTPSVMRSFRRYTQHYTINGVAPDLLWHPLSAMAWDNMADHWVETVEDISLPFREQDYPQRMQPHNFGDHNFAIELTGMGYCVHEAAGFRPGGVKLIHFLKRRSDLSQEQFVARWRDRHGPAVLDALRPLGILRKYQHSPQLPLDPGVFRGTLFERGGVGLYAGIEEFWFPNLAALEKLRNDERAFAAIRASDAALVDPEQTFSMVTTERVIYDYSVPGKESPLPAVLQPGSLESLVDAQGYSGWNIPPP